MGGYCSTSMLCIIPMHATWEAPGRLVWAWSVHGPAPRRRTMHNPQESPTSCQTSRQGLAFKCAPAKVMGTKGGETSAGAFHNTLGNVLIQKRNLGGSAPSIQPGPATLGTRLSRILVSAILGEVDSHNQVGHVNGPALALPTHRSPGVPTHACE